VKFLLQKGGKTLAFKVNKNGRTPMDEAMHNDRQECVKVIMDLTCDDDDDENDGGEEDILIEEEEEDGKGGEDQDDGNDDAMMME
jgi:ankyrin repeat protein